MFREYWMESLFVLICMCVQIIFLWMLFYFQVECSLHVVIIMKIIYILFPLLQS